MLRAWLASFGLEALALSLLLGSADPETVKLLAFLAAHAAASAFGSLAVATMFPPSLRRPRRRLWLLLFGLNFFVPLLGLLASLMGAVAGTLFPRLLKRDYFRRVAAPEYTPDRTYDLSKMRGGAARARLRDASLEPAHRVAALMALAGNATPATGPLLREMLGDPVDDLRLLAYGLLDRREKAISERLIRERALLADITDPIEQRATAGRVAQLFWELVYQDLVRGDMASYALEQARRHALLAVEGRGAGAATASVWLLLAKINLHQRETRGVEQALDAAQSFGLPRRTIVPYLAELRFLEGRYAEIPALMYDLPPQQSSGTLAAVQQYWAV
jgi:hypothetical protein